MKSRTKLEERKQMKVKKLLIMKALQKEKRKIIQYCLERLHNEEILTEQKAIQIIKVF